MKQPLKLSSAASAHLDLVRGVAAVLVMVGHLRNIYLVDFTSLARPNLAVRALYFVTGLGHQSVMIFFALSGFLVGSSVTRAFAADSWSFRSYMVDRLSRLLTVLWPALLLGLALDVLGNHLTGGTGIYGGDPRFGNVVQAPVSTHLGPGILAANAFFLQTIVAPTLGSNGPLWSLANEWWYYVLFPLCLLGLRRTGPVSGRLVAIAGIGALLVFLPGGLLLGFVIWVAGAISAHVRRPAFMAQGWGWFVSVLLTSLGFIAAIIATRTGRLVGDSGDLAVGLSFTLVMWFISQSPKTTLPSAYSSLTKSLSKVSYTMYLVHLPAAIFVRGVFGLPARWEPGAQALLHLALICVGLMAYAAAVWYAFERQTPLVRGRLRAALGVSSSRVAASPAT